MHEFSVFNGEILRAEKSFLSAVSSAALYGKGVFTTVAVHDSKPFFWEKHWRRLGANAAKIGVDWSSFSESVIISALLEIIAENNLTNGRARVTFFDESSSRMYQPNAENKTSFSIQTANFRRTAKNFRLAVSPFPINSKSPLAGVKSCNYLENIFALEDARSNGFDETVRLNERGEIASAATANIFWTKGERIFTPSLMTGCLAGTTRELICEKFPVAELKTGLDELNDADAIFLTSAGIAVAQAAEFQNKKLPGESSKIIETIRKFLTP